MTKLRIAVIGTGHLGRIHARLLQDHPQAELVAVVDPDEAARQQTITTLGTRSVADIAEIGNDIDAAIVATPTCLHERIGSQLLSQGIHVLMEKPLANTSRDARALAQLAERNQCVLQVGHVERFNPAIRTVAPLLAEPKYIEARRLSSFTFRSTDIGVVLDLMIHDLDLILDMVRSEVVHVQALGTSVIGGQEDMAQARLEFQNGCVANLTASRTSMHAERKMDVYCPSIYAGIDFAQRRVEVVRPCEDILSRTFDWQHTNAAERLAIRDNLFETLLKREPLGVPDGNPLADEQQDFISAIANGNKPQVSGAEGLSAVALAERICEAISAHCWNGSAAGPMGPQALPGPTILRTPMADPAGKGWQRKAG